MSHVPRQAFGLTLSPEFPLPGLRSSNSSEPGLSIRLAEPGELAAATGAGPGQLLWSTVMDDAQNVRLERTTAGGHRLQYGARAEFLLRAEGDAILCAPADPADAAWKRFLLDTVLTTTSLLHGFEALHASTVVMDGNVVAFLASTGGGKTSLAYELVRRGAPLFADDVLALERGSSGVVAHPGPALMNLPATAGPTDEVGRRLAVFGDEVWLELTGDSLGDAAPGAVFLLHRHAECGEPLLAEQAGSLGLMPHALGLDGSHDRLRKRFELFADLADQVPIYRLEAHPSVGPGALADLVEAAVAPAGRAPDRVVVS